MLHWSSYSPPKIKKEMKITIWTTFFTIEFVSPSWDWKGKQRLSTPPTTNLNRQFKKVVPAIHHQGCEAQPDGAQQGRKKITDDSTEKKEKKGKQISEWHVCMHFNLCLHEEAHKRASEKSLGGTTAVSLVVDCEIWYSLAEFHHTSQFKGCG